MSYQFHANEKVQRVLHGVIGICTEVGELQEGLGTQILQERKVNIVNLKEEIGDIFWYMAILDRELSDDSDFNVQYNDEVGLISPEFILRELGIQSAILLDIMKKKLFYNKPIDVEKFAVSYGHINDYLECLMLSYNLSKESVLETNINKLKARYGEKFSNEKAIDRDLDAEGKILSQ